MPEINWSIFEVKFYGKQQTAFERLSYALFCSLFNLTNGIFAYKNQIGIETEPIEINGKFVGFQAKYIGMSVPVSLKKTAIINSIEQAKTKNPKLNEVYLYINKSFSESRSNDKKLPRYIEDIEKRAKDLKINIVWQLPSQIEKQLSLSRNLNIAHEFFPDFYDFQRQNFILKHKDEILSVAKTAIIQLKIEKIKELYDQSDWDLRKRQLTKLERFSDHTNEVVAESILVFLSDVSNQTRANMPSSIAGTIFSLILTFFPASYKEDEEGIINSGELCLNIGFNLVYDALIHADNFMIAQYGLLIWKYIFRESKRSNINLLVVKVIEQYRELERTLDRPERSDLEDAKLLVKTFKEDLDDYDLSFPVLPKELANKIENS